MSLLLDSRRHDYVVPFYTLREYLQRTFDVSRKTAHSALFCAKDGVTKKQIRKAVYLRVIRVVDGRVRGKPVHQLWLVDSDNDSGWPGQIIDPFGWEAHALYDWLISRVLSRQLRKRR